MKITPVPTAIVPTLGENGQPTSQVQTLRMKIKTNATPLYEEPPMQQEAQQLPIETLNKEAEATAEATQPLSPQLALLAKQRRALQQERRELENQKKALLSQNTGTSMVDVARLKSEPLSVLLENGVTYEQLTEAIMANQGNTEVRALKAEIESLKQGIDQRFTEKEQLAEKQVLAEMRREADMLVKNDDFELVRETQSVPKVMQLIERTYRETGEVLDVSEALRLVENEIFKDAQRLATLKKLQGQQTPMTSQVQPQQRFQGMRTLTNKDTASVPLSAKARALAAFYGTLKK